jgi:hypothetical protein
MRNERDAMSAMVLSIPAMDTHSSGLVRCRCCRSANARSRCPAITDLDEWRRAHHATVGVLSQNSPTWQCWRLIGATHSSTSQARSSPAISRSEFVIVPFGLLEDTTFLVMSGGKAIRHTIGLMCVVPLNHTPPAPKAHASTYPTKFGVPGHSSSTDVGREPMSLVSVIQSRSACLRCLLM